MKHTTEALVALLETIKRHVQSHDSFEGCLTYSITEEVGEWEVSASYRIGNQDGQGGIRIIEPSPARTADP